MIMNQLIFALAATQTNLRRVVWRKFLREENLEERDRLRRAYRYTVSKISY